MKVILLFVFFGTSMAALVPIGSLPLSKLFTSGQEYAAVSVQPQNLQLSPYQAAYPQYLVYNIPQVNTGTKTIPTAVFANGRPAVAQIPTTYNFYGTPVYDFRFPLNPILPGVKPMVPGHIPKPAIPTSTQKPLTDDDGIEKLDEKVEPGLMNENAGDNNDDTVTVDAS